MKKALKITGIVLASIFILLLLIPVFFKGPITEAVRAELNKQLDATVEFDDVGISVIRNFPNLNFRLHGLSIKGAGDFEDITLLSSDYIGMTFNLSSLWKKDSPYEIRRLDIEGPFIHLITLPDGRTNYDILPAEDEPTEVETEGDGFDFALQSYRISNGHIILDDRAAKTKAELQGFNHRGSGNFTDAVFEWESSTTVDAISVAQSGVRYLASSPLKWELELGVDLNQSEVKILQNDLRLSELQLDLEGLIRFPEGENMYFDLNLYAPGNEFGELFSVLPIAAMADIERLSAEGVFSLNAEMKGEANFEEEIYPSFRLAALVENGSVLYPGMDMSLDGIDLDLLIVSPDSDLDNMSVSLSTFSFSAGGNPISGNFFLTRPISDPRVTTNVLGNLNLEDLSKIFPMEDIHRLSGFMNVDLNADFAMSQVDNEQWEEMELDGNISLREIQIDMAGMPEISVPSGAFSFDRRSTTVSETQIKIGKSDMTVSGNFNNLLVLYTGVRPFRGNLDFRSDLMDIDDMMAAFTGETTGETETFNAIADTTPSFFNVDIVLSVAVGRMVYQPYIIENLGGRMNMKPQVISAPEVSLVLNDSDLRGSISIQNWYEFAMADERMTVDANLRAGTLDIDKLMPPADDAAIAEGETHETGQSKVPPFKYNIHLVAQADRVIYRPFELKAVTTRGYLTERDVHLENFNGQLFGDWLQGSGFIGNYMNYVFLDETLTGELDLSSPGLNLNKWMEAMMSEEQNIPPEEVSTDEFEPIMIPKNLDLAIRANMGNLSYFDMNFQNARGALEIKEGALEIKDFIGQIFKGNLKLNGLYDTSDEMPFTSMKLDVERMDITNSFANIASLAAVAPLFEYVNGLFTSSLVMATDLGPGMMPVWSTFNAEGFVRTIDAYIQNFPPLQRAADRLKVDLFERLSLNNTQNWFEIVNGTFDLKPVKHVVSDTELEFMGKHTIGGTMDYLINASIPQDILGSGTVGAAATSGIDFIRSEAGKRGVNLGEGTHVDVAISLKGTLRNPDVGVQLLNVSTSEEVRQRAETVVRDRLEQEKEEVEERIKQEAEDVRETVDEMAKKIQDSLRRLAEEQERELTEGARREAEARLRGLLGDDAGKTGKDTTEKDKTEDIKQRIKNFNPFRRGQNDDG